MASGSRKVGQNIVVSTVTEQFKRPVRAIEDFEQVESIPPQLRGKLRTPRDPRIAKKTLIRRPPRKNPLTGKGIPYRNERRLVYEAEEYPLEDGDAEESE